MSSSSDAEKLRRILVAAKAKGQAVLGNQTAQAIGRLMGVKIEDQSKATKDDVVYRVCVGLTDPLLLPDNVVSECCACQKPLQKRPATDGIPGTHDICMECVAGILEAKQ